MTEEAVTLLKINKALADRVAELEQRIEDRDRQLAEKQSEVNALLSALNGERDE